MLLVQSKVRDLIRERDLRATDEFLSALNEQIYATVAAAMRRCEAERAQDLRPSDV